LATGEDNAFLTNIPLKEEAKFVVINNMNSKGVPGPNGLSRCFVQHYWDVVGDIVYKSVLQFFKSGWILPNLNSNMVVLIPKTSETSSIDHYRPMVLLVLNSILTIFSCNQFNLI